MSECHALSSFLQTKGLVTTRHNTICRNQQPLSPYETGIQYPTHDNDLTEPRAAGELTEGSNHAGSMAEAVGTIKSCFAILLKDRPLIGLWYKKHSHKQKITGASYKKPTGRGKHSSMKKEGLPSK
jgi:hypothetical protein